MLSFSENELFETRIDDTSLIINIPKWVSINTSAISRHIKFIATTITKTHVLNLETYQKETEMSL